MKELIWGICIGLFCLLAILIILYVILIRRFRNINVKLYKYKKEELIKDKNVLIIYQPSRHQTTYKIVERLKNLINNSSFGYVI